MRKIINSTYISIDGVIQHMENWPSVEGDSEGSYALQSELLLSCDALLMGRATYDGFAPVWPTRSGDPYSDHINTMTKYVVSSTLRGPEWNNTKVISEDSIEAIRQLKEQPGKDIVQYGFGRLSFALMEQGLLDELRLWVHPFFVGQGGGESLLYRGCPTTTFDLIDTHVLKSGMVVLSYRYLASTEDSPTEATT
ncbi:MAG TPA: dihydrofolate reductase family protein [Gaiellaceae bacterium]|jgi:dihydrofolate reductase|nr:dihydrofolate reductase family protein [Gaiellaceae bacterium]